MKFEELPRAVKSAAILGLGYRNRLRRFGSEYKKEIAFLAATRKESLARREAIQQMRLRALVISAQAGTEHYQRCCDEFLAHREFASLGEALLTLPVLEKTDLKKDPKSFVNDRVPLFTASSTSGSTGSPTRVEHDAASVQRRFAYFSDHQAMCGVGMLDPSVRLSGRLLVRPGRFSAKPWLYNPAERQLFLSTYHLDHSHSSAIIAKLRRLRPTLIDGYPSAILQLLKLAESDERAIASLRMVIATAETLSAGLREELERYTRVPVLDYYSASEGLPFIQQCPNGTYHVRWQSGVVEIRDGTNGVKLEGDGELVVTSFVQDRTPLIRYATGDLVAGLEQNPTMECGCGLVTPTVERVLGRLEDMVYTRDGRALGMFTYRTLKYIEGIAESQVIQNTTGSFTLNLVRVPGSDPATIRTQVKDSFERALGYEIDLEVVEMQAIPKGANGKVRLLKSLVEPGENYEIEQ